MGEGHGEAGGDQRGWCSISGSFHGSITRSAAGTASGPGSAAAASCTGSSARACAPRPWHPRREPGTGEVADVEQRAEEGGEEHHLGEDEPAHAPAERAVHLCAVESGAALADDVAEPAEQHVGDDQPADEEDPRAMGFLVAGGEVVEPGTQAEHRHQQADAGDDRPLALGGDVIVFVACHVVLLIAPQPVRAASAQ